MTTPTFNNGGTQAGPTATRVHKFPLPAEGRQYRPTYSRGQYVLPELDGVKLKRTRATTVAHALDDQAGLDKWKTRQTVRGLVELNRDGQDMDALLSIDLLEDPRDVNRDLDQVVGQAQDVAGSSYGSELGTAIHAWTEAVERDGTPLDEVPGQFRPYVSAYMDALAAAGIVTAEGMVERIVVNDTYETAGTFDRIYRLPDGTHVIGDVKTSKMTSLNYSWLSWAAQFAIYAGADRMVAPDGDGYEPMPEVSQEFALVAHIPSDQPGHCELITVDLQAGRQALETAMDVRYLRTNARKVIPRAWALPDPLMDSPGPTLEDMVRMCRTQEDMAMLWEANSDEWTDAHTELGMSVLRGTLTP